MSFPVLLTSWCEPARLLQPLTALEHVLGRSGRQRPQGRARVPALSPGMRRASGAGAAVEVPLKAAARGGPGARGEPPPGACAARGGAGRAAPPHSPGSRGGSQRAPARPRHCRRRRRSGPWWRLPSPECRRGSGAESRPPARSAPDGRGGEPRRPWATRRAWKEAKGWAPSPKGRRQPGMAAAPRPPCRAWSRPGWRRT